MILKRLRGIFKCLPFVSSFSIKFLKMFFIDNNINKIKDKNQQLRNHLPLIEDITEKSLSNNQIRHSIIIFKNTI